MGFLSWDIKIKDNILTFTRFCGKVIREYYYHEIENVDIKMWKRSGLKSLEISFIDGFQVKLTDDNEGYKDIIKYFETKRRIPPQNLKKTILLFSSIKIPSRVIFLFTILLSFGLTITLFPPGEVNILIFYLIFAVIIFIMLSCGIMRHLWTMEINGILIKIKRYFGFYKKNYKIYDIQGFRRSSGSSSSLSEIKLEFYDGFVFSIDESCSGFKSLWCLLDELKKIENR